MEKDGVKFKYGVKFKAGVICKYLQEDIVIAINMLAQLARRFKKNIVITSMNDGEHKEESLHWENRAIDIRIWNLKVSERKVITNFFNADYRYDCVIEKDHIHLEVDPK